VLMATDVPQSAGFFAELRRRRVLRVVGFYAISVWLVLQVSNIVFPALYLPPWALTVVVVAIAAGFPIVAVLAWVFDLTPQGLVRTGPAEPDMFGEADVAVMDRPRIWIDIAIIGVLLAIVAYLLIEPTRQTILEPSIAVLPFEDDGAPSDDRNFGHAITDSLIASLARIPEITVASPSSSFRYVDRPVEARAVGDQLNVRTVLVGGVRRLVHRHANRLEAQFEPSAKLG
jgi:hypothetical protein